MGGVCNYFEVMLLLGIWFVVEVVWCSGVMLVVV